MDLRLRLLTTVVCCLLVTGGASPPGKDRGGVIGLVTADVGSNSVQLNGTRTEIVKSERSGFRATTAGRGAVSDSGARRNSSASPLSAAQLQGALNAICIGNGICGTRQGAELNPLLIQQDPADPAAADDAAASVPARIVTIDDVARFLPATVALHAEPDGWADVGVPANFWTYVRPVTVEAALLGDQAAVRFTPQLYNWEYGDGASRTTRSGGASWSGLNQQELSATSTSHVYSTRAAVNASVTVFWSAEYRFAGSEWIPVAGAVSNSSPEIRMLVVKERTVLTAR